MNSQISRNKKLYKLFLTVLKYTPLFSATIQIVLLILNYLGVYVSIITYIGGTSAIFIVLLYMMSYIFNFCYLYRIPLYYNTLMLIFGGLRNLGYLPLEVLDLYRFYTIILGIFIVLFIIIAYKTRNNPKIDHIKELCKRYGCCS